MKKHILWLLALAFAAGVAMAQVGFPSEGDLDGDVEELYDENHDQAAVKEKVKVKKVARVIKKGTLPKVKLTRAQSLAIHLMMSTSEFLILLIDSMKGFSQA